MAVKKTGESGGSQEITRGEGNGAQKAKERSEDGNENSSNGNGSRSVFEGKNVNITVKPLSEAPEYLK